MAVTQVSVTVLSHMHYTWTDCGGIGLAGTTVDLGCYTYQQTYSFMDYHDLFDLQFSLGKMRGCRGG